MKAINIGKHRVKQYKCKSCGHVKMIGTNHYGECLDYCEGCSWLAYQHKSYLIPRTMHGRMFECIEESKGAD